MKKIVVCNHKMFLTYDEAIIFEKKLRDINTNNVELIICPSFINLNIFKNYNLGSQDAFYEDKGSYTSFVSSYMLSLMGVNYSILGHFEKRVYDTNEIINKKVKAAIRNSIIPILCIGENSVDKELRKSSEIIKRQLKECLKGVNKDDYIIIAYEPGYVIGRDNSLSKNEILDTFKYIRKVLEMCNISNYKLLYGGSINKDNIKNILSDDIDGYLIGASSVDINELENIIKSIK